MASQPEVPVYDPGVYQYETTDPVQGGIGGIANLPLLNLGDRTAWLKQQLDSLINGSLIPPTVAPLSGPEFTNSPTAPNVAPGNDSTLISNTNFVQTAKHGLVVVPVVGSVNVVLSQPQWGVAMLVFTGVLTGNISAIFPSQPGNWIVRNATTGGFSINCKTTAGTGVTVTGSGPFNAIWCDGVDVNPQISPFLLALTNPLVIAALGFTPVQQGGGTNQTNNKVYVGWSLGLRLRAQVDATDMGNFAMEATSNSYTAPQAVVNSAYWYGKNTAGVLQPLVGTDGSNNTTMFAGPSGVVAWRVLNNAGNAHLAYVGAGGGFHALGGIVADTGNITTSAGDINSSGNVSAGGNVVAGARLRAVLGARNSGDPNAATLLADHTFTYDTTNQFSNFSPNSFAVQMMGAIVAVTAGTVSTAVNLRQAFQTNICGAMVCLLGQTPPQGVTISVQPSSPSQVIVTTTSPIVGGGSVGVAVLAFGF